MTAKQLFRIIITASLLFPPIFYCLGWKSRSPLYCQYRLWFFNT